MNAYEVKTGLCRYSLHITMNIAYHNTEVKLMVMGNFKNLWYLISQVYVNHENHENLMLANYICFTVCVCASNVCTIGD